MAAGMRYSPEEILGLYSPGIGNAVFPEGCELYVAEEVEPHSLKTQQSWEPKAEGVRGGYAAQKKTAAVIEFAPDADPMGKPRKKRQAGPDGEEEQKEKKPVVVAVPKKAVKWGEVDLSGKKKPTPDEEVVTLDGIATGFAPKRAQTMFEPPVANTEAVRQAVEPRKQAGPSIIDRIMSEEVNGRTTVRSSHEDTWEEEGVWANAEPVGFAPRRSESQFDPPTVEGAVARREIADFAEHKVEAKGGPAKPSIIDQLIEEEAQRKKTSKGRMMVVDSSPKVKPRPADAWFAPSKGESQFRPPSVDEIARPSSGSANGKTAFDAIVAEQRVSRPTPVKQGPSVIDKLMEEEANRKGQPLQQQARDEPVAVESQLSTDVSFAPQKTAEVYEGPSVGGAVAKTRQVPPPSKKRGRSRGVPLDEYERSTASGNNAKAGAPGNTGISFSDVLKSATLSKGTVIQVANASSKPSVSAVGVPEFNPKRRGDTSSKSFTDIMSEQAQASTAKSGGIRAPTYSRGADPVPFDQLLRREEQRSVAERISAPVDAYPSLSSAPISEPSRPQERKKPHADFADEDLFWGGVAGESPAPAPAAVQPKRSRDAERLSRKAKWLASQLALELGGGNWDEFAEALSLQDKDTMLKSLLGVSSDSAQMRRIADTFFRKYT